MKTEKSCGAVLFTMIDGKRHYVLIQTQDGRNVAPPKGHVEPGETEEETALREIKEETGVHAVLIDGFRKDIVYALPRGNQKHVVFFLAQYQNQTAHSPQGEKGTVLMLPINEALAAISFDDAREVLVKADQFLG